MVYNSSAAELDPMFIPFPFVQCRKVRINVCGELRIIGAEAVMTLLGTVLIARSLCRISNRILLQTRQRYWPLRALKIRVGPRVFLAFCLSAVNIWGQLFLKLQKYII